MTRARRALRTLAIGSVGLAATAFVLARPAPSPRVRCAPPVEIHVFKSEGELELRCAGERVLVASATFGADPTGPKEREGDERTPEGAYTVVAKNAAPRFHRFLALSYPNDVDRRRAAARGVPPGGGIGIHGVRADLAPLARAWLRLARASGIGRVWGPTDGCVGLQNEDVDAVYEAVPVGARVVIAPARRP